MLQDGLAADQAGNEGAAQREQVVLRSRTQQPDGFAVEGGVHQARTIRIATGVGAGDGHYLEQLVAGEAYVLGAGDWITAPSQPRYLHREREEDDVFER